MVTGDTRPMSLPPGPVSPAERVLAPDLARGTMLLFIALANASAFAGPAGGVAWHDPSAPVVDLVLLTLVHARSYPVFAVMFGYGLVQLARRHEAAGATSASVRRLLVRRNAWLVGFGALHATLLYYGDFLAAYGLIGIAATLVLLGRSDRVQRLVLWAWTAALIHALVLAVQVVSGLPGGSGSPARVPVQAVASFTAPDYATSMVLRLQEWLAHTAAVLPVIVIVWLGMWAAQRRLLEDAAMHRHLLQRVAVVALGIAVTGALPLALVSAGLLRADAATIPHIVQLHQVSGSFGGPGFVALIGLAALGVPNGASGRVATMAGAVAALGQRSLSGYLCQSVAWLVLLSPFMLALPRRSAWPALTVAITAVLVWLLTLTGAWAMHRRAHPGPAESVLRRLTYGRRPSRSTATPA